jgi:hypothetical protein
MLVLSGNDREHDPEIAREIAELAPDAELLSDWRAPGEIDGTVERVRQFQLRYKSN